MDTRPDLTGLDVNELAKELLGSNQVALSPVQTEGMETHAYRVAANDRVACLRISRSTRAFAKDQTATRTFVSRIGLSPRPSRTAHTLAIRRILLSVQHRHDVHCSFPGGIIVLR